MRTVLTADRLLIGHEKGGEVLDHPVVLIEDGRIARISSREQAELPHGIEPLHFPGATLAPAYLDVHIHGSAGHDVMEATPEALHGIAKFLALHGTGRFLATTVTAPVDTTLRSLAGIAKYIASQESAGRAGDKAHAGIIGIHFEGPFISPHRRGVHPPDLILEPDIELFDRMYEAAGGHARLITIAPEMPGALDLARHAVSRGVRVSLGHSNATAAEARAGIEAGAVSATHTFNAMRPFDHREPGIIGTVLANDSLFAELICDGIHTSREAVSMWWRSKGAARAILITDAMAAAGKPDGMYRLGAMEVQVKDGKASAGDALAGSLLTLDRGVANLVEFTGARVDDALRAAAANPAEMIGVAEGALAPGAPANIVAVDSAGRLVASIIGGTMAA